MQYIVFSLLIISNLLMASTTKFDSKECLRADLNTSIEHNAYLFGMIKAKLDLNKKDCVINISFKQILEKKWTIDLCREPIHIKYSDKGSLSVYKKLTDCENQTSSFCINVEELLVTIQDHGLIFAKGDREKLMDPHGQIYCSYLLLKQYLQKNNVFSLYTDPINIYDESAKSCALPLPKKEVMSEEVQSIENEVQTIESSTSVDNSIPEDTNNSENKPKF